MKFVFKAIFELLRSKTSKVVPIAAESIDGTTWTTADGRVLKIADMDLQHLKNTCAWMERAASRREDLTLGLSVHPKYLTMKATIAEKEKVSGNLRQNQS